MAFRFVTTDTGGVFYAVTAEGGMLYFRDLAQDGTVNWAFGGVGQSLGSGWDAMNYVFCGGEGILYAINAGDELLYYRDLARDGTAAWAPPGSGQKIGAGWTNLQHVVSGGDGVLYAVDASGNLSFYRDLARDGTANWANGGVGQQIASGWEDFLHVVSGGDGILYAVSSQGDLLYFRDEARDGSAKWAFGGVGQPLATGWHVYEHVIAGANGALYAITADGTLLFFRDLARDGSRQWANQGVGRMLAMGWQMAWHGATDPLGYCWPQSAAPGETIEFHVSCPQAYAVNFVRYNTAADGSNVAEHLAQGPNQPAAPLPTPPLAWRNGCGWPISFRFTVPADWVSGIYAAECVVAGMSPAPVVFVVKPAGPPADFLTLANTNTWNAYNDFGGLSKYTSPAGAELSFMRPNPNAWPQGTTHLTAAELWVLNWLRGAGYGVDVVTDSDFHQGLPNLAAYKAIILNTHPEYWTTKMLDRLQAYMAGGGNLLYLGGNGLYEEVTFSADGQTLTLLHGNADTPRPDCLFRNAVPPRPERALLGVGFEDRNYFTYAPYQVLMPEHALVAPLGLTAGAVIGQNGNNGAASGWEMDTSAGDGGPAGLQVLARGTNVGNDGTVYGADMTYYRTAAGGFVFAVGSLAFGGSLAVDAALQGIVGNALNACLRT